MKSAALVAIIYAVADDGDAERAVGMTHNMPDLHHGPRDYA